MRAIALDVLMQALGSLESRRRESAAAFRSSEPFPHIVVDDVFPHQFIDGILEGFPAPDAPTWSRWATPGMQITLRSDLRRERDVPPLKRDLVRSMEFGSNETSRPAAHVTDESPDRVPWRRRQMRELP